MSFDDLATSPPLYGRIRRPQGYLPLSSTEDASPMATYGHGTLAQLIKSRSSASLHFPNRRPSSIRGRDTPIDEEQGSPRLKARRYSNEDSEDIRRSMSDGRRLSVILGPQMRSQRLIGNSNPRYKWEKYWKTEEELKAMKKPLYVLYHDMKLHSPLIDK